jgi:hypothetical protein
MSSSMLSSSTTCDYLNNGSEEVPKDVVSVLVDASITDIHDQVFQQLLSLQSVVFISLLSSSPPSSPLPSLSHGLSRISGFVFYSCQSLTSIIIPSSVVNICSSAFRKARNPELTVTGDLESAKLSYGLLVAAVQIGSILGPMF